MIPIVVWSEYNAYVSGSVWKLARCEKCSGEYVYEMTRTGVGTSLMLSVPTAESRAEKSLQRKLERGCDAVPCPECGWYQADMVRKLRRGFRLWLYYAGVALASVGFVALAYVLGRTVVEKKDSEIGWTPGLVLFGIGIVTLLVRLVQRGQYDPNSGDPSARIHLGRQMTFSREEFERRGAGGQVM